MIILVISLMLHILRVGDIIEFNVSAYDPKGRKIVYGLKELSESDYNILSVEITQDMIGKSKSFDVYAKTESDYKNEDIVVFLYTILPES